MNKKVVDSPNKEKSQDLQDQPGGENIQDFMYASNIFKYKLFVKPTP